MKKKTVLFICVHNSARSQMAEAFLKHLAAGAFAVESAGLSPTSVNPLVVEAMAEKGIDLSGATTQSAFDLFRQGRLFEYVITVCDASSEKQCPIFPGLVHREHWPFEDPAALEGTHEQKLAGVRLIRDRIEEAIRLFVRRFGSGEDQGAREGGEW
ncbi:arsenate reductase ArsC [Desulfolutivibrio sulfoxidireducens]|uniref:arsenate reductase ArsC n=1 Tax=Desulfolutivibrio sulfoxidireducens TaxID=2773299 RepID=UPI00159DE9D5|nr:arsenate reductase ArsC [Desulfolutivibrio sulfoxidireducens]QLA15903.1 arsenate reductase ArsC [Desulfolutivibrio sulfoxidireducens]QLA20195.1 arsenate reductase ArsC [Desulfolutivibrio sulfoxidireducens]